MKPAISVVISARGDKYRLALCLEGLALQADSSVEVVVINDGGPPLDEVFVPFLDRLALRYDRLDPPASTYRLAAARNHGLRMSRADRALFLDQDCVIGPRVLAEHASQGARPVVVVGVRRHLAQSDAETLTPGDIPSLMDRNLRHDVRMTSPWFRGVSGKSVGMVPQLVFGCHFSAPAEKIRAIGGFWEAFVGWGHEDVEMAIRLGRAGCMLLVRTDLAVVHLDHALRVDPDAEKRNSDLLRQTERDSSVISRGAPLELLT